MKTENIIQQKSFVFAVRIINACKYLKKEKHEFIIAKQMLRSGVSIGANVEEAIGAQSKADFIHKLSISYKEARETLYWLRLLYATDYLDKEMLTVADLKPEQRPINQKWSWDRILRSPFIKQADVLQGLYFFEDDFTKEEIARNFNFYEPRTVHESSLSPCVHVILACLIGNFEKANEMYLRTSRLDLDDYNNDTEDGLHITSMAGTWLAVVKGFGGMRVKDGKLFFTPNLPPTWQSVSFKVRFRGAIINLKVSKTEITIVNTGFAAVTTNINGKDYLLQPHTEVKI